MSSVSSKHVNRRGPAIGDSLARLPNRIHMVARSDPSKQYPEKFKVSFCGQVWSNKDTITKYPKQQTFINLADARSTLPPGATDLLPKILGKTLAIYIMDDGSLEVRMPWTTTRRATTRDERRKVDDTRGETKKKPLSVLSLNCKISAGTTHGCQTQHCYKSMGDFKQDFGIRTDKRVWTYLTGYDPSKLFPADNAGRTSVDRQILSQYVNTEIHVVRRGIVERPNWHAMLQAETEWRSPEAVLGRPLPLSVDGYVVTETLTEKALREAGGSWSGCATPSTEKRASTARGTQSRASTREASVVPTSRAYHGAEGLPAADLPRADANASVRRQWYP